MNDTTRSLGVFKCDDKEPGVYQALGRLTALSPGHLRGYLLVAQLMLIYPLRRVDRAAVEVQKSVAAVIIEACIMAYLCSVEVAEP